MSNYDLQVDIAKGIFLKYDQHKLIRKFSLEADEECICTGPFAFAGKAVRSGSTQTGSGRPAGITAR